MDEDQVIAEVRRTKEQIAARHNYDVRALAKTLREKQGKDGRKVVSFPARRPAGTKHP